MLRKTCRRLVSHVVRYILTIQLLIPSSVALAAPTDQAPRSNQRPSIVKATCQFEARCRLDVSVERDSQETPQVAVASHDIAALRAGIDVARMLPIRVGQKPINHSTLGKVTPLADQSTSGQKVQVYDKGGVLYLETSGTTKFLTIASPRFAATGDPRELKEAARFYELLSQAKIVRKEAKFEVDFPAIDRIPDSPLLRDVTISLRSTGSPTTEGASPTHLVTWVRAPLSPPPSPAPSRAPSAPSASTGSPVSRIGGGGAPIGGDGATTAGDPDATLASRSLPDQDVPTLQPSVSPTPDEPTATPFPARESCFAAPVSENLFPLTFEPVIVPDGSTTGIRLTKEYLKTVAPKLVLHPALTSIRATVAQSIGNRDDILPVLLLNGTPLLKTTDLRADDRVVALWINRRDASLTEPIAIEYPIVITGRDGASYKLDGAGTPLVGISSLHVKAEEGQLDLVTEPFSVSQLAAALGYRNYVLQDPGVCTWAILQQQTARVFNYVSSGQGGQSLGRSPCRAGRNPSTGLCLDDGPAPDQCTADNQECECRALRRTLEDAWRLERDGVGYVDDSAFIAAFILHGAPGRKESCDQVEDKWCDERQKFEERCIQPPQNTPSPQQSEMNQSCRVTTVLEKANTIYQCFDAEKDEGVAGRKAGRYCIDNNDNLVITWKCPLWKDEFVTDSKWSGPPSPLRRLQEAAVRRGQCQEIKRETWPSPWSEIKKELCSPVQNASCLVTVPLRLPVQLGQKADVERSLRDEAIQDIWRNPAGLIDRKGYKPARGDRISKCFDVGPEKRELSPEDNEIGFHAQCLRDNEWDEVSSAACKPVPSCQPIHPNAADLLTGTPWGRDLAQLGRIYKEVPCTVSPRPPLLGGEGLCRLPNEVFDLLCSPKICLNPRNGTEVFETLVTSLSFNEFGDGRFYTRTIANFDEVCRGQSTCEQGTPAPSVPTPIVTPTSTRVASPVPSGRAGGGKPLPAKTCAPGAPSPSIRTDEGVGPPPVVPPAITVPPPKSFSAEGATLVEEHPGTNPSTPQEVMTSQAMVGLAFGNLSAIAAWIGAGVQWIREVSDQDYAVFEIDTALLKDVPSDAIMYVATKEREIREWISEQRAKGRSEAEVEPELQERLTSWLNSDVMRQYPQIRHFYLTAYHLYSFDLFQLELEKIPKLKEALNDFTEEATKQLQQAAKPGGAPSSAVLSLRLRYGNLTRALDQSDLPDDMKQRLRDEFGAQLKEVERQLEIFNRGDPKEIQELTESSIAKLKERSDTWRSSMEGVLGSIEMTRVLEDKPETGRVLGRLEELRARQRSLQDEAVSMAKEANLGTAIISTIIDANLEIPLNLAGVDLNLSERSRLEAKLEQLRSVSREYREALGELTGMIEQVGIAPEVRYLLVTAFSALVQNDHAINSHAMDLVINSVGEVVAQAEVARDVAVAAFITVATSGLGTAVTAIRTTAIGARLATIGGKAMVGIEAAAGAKAAGAARFGFGMVRLGVTGAAYGAAGDFAYQPLAASLNAHRLSRHNKTTFFSELAQEQERLSSDRGERLKSAMQFGAAFGVLGGVSGLLKAGSAVGRVTDTANTVAMVSVVGFGVGSQIGHVQALNHEMRAATAQGDRAEAERLYQEIIRGQNEIAANFAFLFPAYKLWKGVTPIGTVPLRLRKPKENIPAEIIDKVFILHPQYKYIRVPGSRENLVVDAITGDVADVLRKFLQKTEGDPTISKSKAIKHLDTRNGNQGNFWTVFAWGDSNTFKNKFPNRTWSVKKIGVVNKFIEAFKRRGIHTYAEDWVLLSYERKGQGQYHFAYNVREEIRILHYIPDMNQPR